MSCWLDGAGSDDGVGSCAGQFAGTLSTVLAVETFRRFCCLLVNFRQEAKFSVREYFRSHPWAVSGSSFVVLMLFCAVFTIVMYAELFSTLIHF